MKILHVTKKYPNALGGDAIVVQNLEKQQKKNGHKVTILTTNCDEILDKKNLIKFGLKDTPQSLDNITLKRIFSLIDLKLKFPKILKKINPNIVHCHSIDMGYMISKVCEKNKVPIINHFHSGLFSSNEDNKLRSIIMKQILKRSIFDKLIFINKNDFKKINYKSNKGTFIPNGLDLEDFNLPKKIKRNKNTILFAGRIEEYKGLKYLLVSIQKIKSKISNIKLVIIGEGNYINKCKELCKKLNIQKEVFFLGKLSHKKLIKEYLKSSLFVLPSYTSSKTFGLVLLESLANKTPVITTDIVGISKEIKKNNCGIVVRPKNSDLLAKAIIKLLKNPKLAKQMGENGRKLVEKGYNWEKINKKIESFYLEVLG